MPQRHFQLCVVAEGASAYLFAPEPSIAEVAKKTRASRWTVRRWIAWLEAVAKPSDLYRHVLFAAGAPLAVSLLGASELSSRAIRACVGSLRSVAAQVLCLFEALGSALAGQPPGLRCVVEALLANRYRVTTYARPPIPEFAHRTLGGLCETLRSPWMRSSTDETTRSRS